LRWRWLLKRSQVMLPFPAHRGVTPRENIAGRVGPRATTTLQALERAYGVVRVAQV